MAKLEQLEIQIVASTKSGATQGVKNLAEALKSLADASRNMGDLDKVANALAKMAEGTRDVGNAPGNIRKIGTALRHLSEDSANLGGVADGLEKVAVAIALIGQAGKRMDGVGESIRDVTNAAKNASSLTNPAEGAIPDGGTGITASAEEAVDSVRSIGEEAERTIPKVEGFRGVIKRLIGDYHTFRDFSDVGYALKVFGKGLSYVGSAAKKVGKALLSIGWNHVKSKIKSLTGAVSNLANSFKRIAMYRALRTLLREITQGFGEGVKNLYAWAGIVGDSFKPTMDSLATSANYLKNSLGAMVSPLLDALAPAVEVVVDAFVSLLNVINQFLATITGKDSWRKAVRTQTEYVNNTNAATAAQKKLNHQLMAFDELNNLTTSASGGRGGGSSPNIGDDSFVEETLPDWAKDIKDAIDTGDWGLVGQTLANKLNGVLDSWNAEEFGAKIGQKFQDAINFYNGFMETFEWRKLGIKSADFINGILANVSAEDLGNAIVQKFNAAIQFLEGFTAKFDWAGAGKWLAGVLVGAFTGLDWNSLGKLIKNLASGLTKMIKAGLTYLSEHSDKVFKSIGDFFSGLGWDGLKDVVKLASIVVGLKLLFKAVFGDSGLITSVAGKAKGLFKSVFADSGLMSSVKGNVTKFLKGAGLIGLTITAGIALAWAASKILDNIKKYGVDKGVWESLSILTPEAKIKLGLDDKDFIDKMSDLVGIWGPVLKALGIEIPDPKEKSKTTKTALTGTTGSKDKDGNYWKKTASIILEVKTSGYDEAMEQIENATKPRTGTVKINFKASGGTSSAGTTTGGAISIKQVVLKEKGGYVDQGDLFVANETGPELIGTVNGRTAVASNQEITGIADAVYNTGDAEAALLREQNNLLRKLLAKNSNVTLAPTAAAGRWVNQAQTAYARATGG